MSRSALPPLEPPTTPTGALPPIPPPVPPPVPPQVLDGSGVLVVSRYASGFALLDDNGRMASEEGKPAGVHPVMSFAQAFGAEHDDDGHFVCYGMRSKSTGVQEPLAPRLTKAGLALLTSDLAPADLQDVEAYGHLLALDFDLPGHGGWSDSHREVVSRLFLALSGVQAPGTSPQVPLTAPSAFYTTSGGFRLVWALTEPVPVEGARGLEDLLGGLVASAHIAGLEVDVACRDWTRLFRLPQVRRDDKPALQRQTTTQDYFRQSWGRVDFTAKDPVPVEIRRYHPTAFRALSEFAPAEFLVLPAAKRLGEKWAHRIGVVPSLSSALASMVAVGDMPTDGEAQEIMTNPATSKPSLFGMRVQQRLLSFAAPRGKTQLPHPLAVFAHGVLFGGQELFKGASEGGQGLHEGMGRLARAICYCFKGELGDGDGQVGPQKIYAAIIGEGRKVNKLRGAGQRPDGVLCVEVWRLVTHTYRNHRFHTEAVDRERAELAEAATIRIESELEHDLVRSIKIQQQLLAWTQKDAAVGAPATPAQIAWVSANWQNLMILDADKWGRSVLRFTPSGEIAYSRPAKTVGGLYAAIRDSHHTLIDVFQRASEPGEDEIRKGEPELIAENGTTVTSVKCSRLIPANAVELVPEGEAELAPILALALPGMRTNVSAVYNPLVDEWLHHLGGPLHDKLLDWLACFTRISQPVCGLYIQGDPGIGKGMLGQGLAQMTARQKYGKMEQVLEQFQDVLFSTPFIWGDEDATTASRSQKSVMNTYKKVISGEFDTLNPKGVAAVQIDGYWRALITANTDGFLKMDEDVNEADLGAIVVRTLHIHSDSAACMAFLERIGGKGTKAGEGTWGWPEHAIPCHIAWLTKNRVVKPGRRFLVEGVRTDYHDRLAVTTAITDAVLRGLGLMLRKPGQYAHALHVGKDGKVHAFSDGMTRELKQLYAADKNPPRITPRSVGQALKHLSSGKERISLWIDKTATTPGKSMHAWPIDLKRLLANLAMVEEDVNQGIREALTEPVWRTVAPLEVITEHDRDILRNNGSSRLPPPVPPAVNGHNGHHGPNGHINGNGKLHKNALNLLADLQQPPQGKP